MRRDDAIRLLKQTEPELRARGVRSLALFGSTARGDARPDSDVDVLLELDMSRHPTLVDVSQMQFLISNALGTSADLSVTDGSQSGFREHIMTDAIRIF